MQYAIYEGEQESVHLAPAVAYLKALLSDKINLTNGSHQQIIILRNTKTICEWKTGHTYSLDDRRRRTDRPPDYCKLVSRNRQFKISKQQRPSFSCVGISPERSSKSDFSRHQHTETKTLQCELQSLFVNGDKTQRMEK